MGVGELMAWGRAEALGPPDCGGVEDPVAGLGGVEGCGPVGGFAEAIVANRESPFLRDEQPAAMRIDAAQGLNSIQPREQDHLASMMRVVRGVAR